MDFLDPKKRYRRQVRLITGYILISIAIALGTVILVYGAYGYGINTKTGGIIENGLLFVDSKPGGARIYLNGQAQKNNTAARLVLPAGNYDLSLSRNGYRTWERKFTLEEHNIARYIYPFLFPEKPRITLLKSYTQMPSLMTESPDRRWLLLQLPAASPKTVSFDQYDTNDLTKPAEQLTLPQGLLSGADAGASGLSVAEWSTDNNNVLLKHTYEGKDEYIVFNRDKPENSFNVDKLLKIDSDLVVLKNKKADQLYIYDSAARTVQLADVGRASLDAPLVRDVLAFKPYGTSLMTYITDKNMPSGKVQARIWDNGKTYPLYTFTAGKQYFVDAAQFQGHWYYVAGSDTHDRINIYKDPLENIKNPNIGKAIPVLALRELGVTKLSFSTNARFIAIEAGQNFAVYDIETKDNYRYVLKAPLAKEMSWMDGHRLIGQSGGNVLVMDYDSTNQQAVTASSQADGGFFSRDFNHLMTLRQAADGSAFELLNVDMRAGSDLPKQ